jgi:uncharacterized protein YoxC
LNWKEFTDSTGFSFENLSKYSQQQIDKLVNAAALMKLRDVDDTTLIAETINLQNKKTQLSEDLNDKSRELQSLLKIEALLGEAEKEYSPCENDIFMKIKEFINTQNDINDRVADILDPKSEEYQSFISAGKNALEKNGYQPDISHASLRVLHDKMTALEHDLEGMLDEFGEVNNIPLNEKEAEKLLNLRKLKLRVAEEEFQREVSSKLGNKLDTK